MPTNIARISLRLVGLVYDRATLVAPNLWPECGRSDRHLAGRPRTAVLHSSASMGAGNCVVGPSIIGESVTPNMALVRTRGERAGLFQRGAAMFRRL